MKTKIVYCLVSNVDDYYYEHLLISLCSLRKHNPEATVEIVCDNDTLATLKNNRHSIYDYNIEVISVSTPNCWNKKERSRYIKTNLRSLIKGNYLFIDTDTIVCSNLDSIDSITYELAAVKDSHVERPLPKITKCTHETEKWIWGEATKCGKDICGMWHYNSGVIFVKDTPNAYELYKRWANKYKMFLEYDCNIDQLPLLLSNNEMGNVIYPLDSRFNCQVSFEEGRINVHKAFIIHYFPGQKKSILSSSWILDPVKDTGMVNSSIQKIIDDPYSFFKNESRIIFGDPSIALLKSPLVEAYYRSHRILNIFISILETYHKLKDTIRRITNK